MVDLLPAGLVSHKLYNNLNDVTTAPMGNRNCWGVRKPGKMLNFSYESASVGAGFISCEGQRVCGATMTSDGLGRWAVPSAKDVPDVLNMLARNLQNALEYHDETAERIYEKLSASFERVKQASDTDYRSKISDLEARINSLEKSRMDRDPKASQHVAAHIDNLEQLAQNFVSRIRSLELIVQNLQQNNSGGGMLDGRQVIEDRVSAHVDVSNIDCNATSIAESPQRPTDQSARTFSQDQAHSTFYSPPKCAANEKTFHSPAGSHLDSSGTFSAHSSATQRQRNDYAAMTKQSPESFRPKFFQELEEEDEKAKSRLPSKDQRVPPPPVRLAESLEAPGLPGQLSSYSNLHEFSSYRDRSKREVTPSQEPWGARTMPSRFDAPAPMYSLPSRSPRKQKQEGCKQQ